MNGYSLLTLFYEPEIQTYCPLNVSGSSSVCVKRETEQNS